VAKATLKQPFSLPGNTNLFVISGNGSNTVVVLDGSLSSDANNDPLTYGWLAGSLTPFAMGAMTTNVWNLGVYDLVLVVSDGKATSTANLEFEVINTSSAIVELALAVEQSSLDRTTKRQLEEVLVDNSGNSDAMNLEAFQNKVQSYVSPIDPALATALESAASSILNSIGSP